MAGRLPRVRSKRRRRLRSHRLLAVTILALIVLGAGGTSVGYLTLKPRADQLQAAITADLQAGQRELEAGKNALTQASSKHDTSLVTQADGHFVTARGNFQAASALADTSRLLRYMEFTPALGDFARSRHTAVDGIAQMGVGISDAGRDVAALDEQLMNAPAAGRTLLTALDQAYTGVAPLRGDLQRAQVAAAQVNAHVLPSGQQTTFVKARADIDSALAGLAEFARLMPVLTDVLGGNGTRSYLVEQVNPAELRAGGGFIGTYSLLQADHGSVTVVRSGDSYELAYPRPLPGQPGFIPQPGPYREIVPQVSWSFVDSNEFPDFPSNAQTAETFVEPRIGKIDGVISIDYFAVAKMLEITGPVQVAGYGSAFDGGSFVKRIMDLELAGDPHKDVLSALAGPLMTRITSLTPDRWPALITALSGLALNRSVQVYLNNPANEAEVDRVGWSGRVNPSNFGDFMMEVESNYGSGKTNYFLRRDYTVVLSRDGSVLHHKVIVDYYGNNLNAGTYLTNRAIGRFYVGPDATFTSNNFRPATYAYPSPPGGTQVVTGWLPLVVCCYGHAEVTLEYDTPWLADSKGIDTIYWQKQPGTLNDSVDLTWNDGSGHSYRANGNLGQDLIVRLMAAGVILTTGHPAAATLPSLSLG